MNPDDVTPPGDIQICGVITTEADALAKWPGAAPAIPWHIDPAGYRGPMTDDQLRDVFRRAWAAWAAVIEIDPTPAPSAEAAFVRSHFAPVDGPSNVLAWSELADDTNRPKTQRYDSGDNWTDSEDSPTPPGIDLVRVAIHEIGHVIGLGHDAGGADAIMRPSYSPRLPKPTARDVQRMVALGYRKRTGPPPSPPSPPPPDPPPIGG